MRAASAACRASAAAVSAAAADTVLADATVFAAVDVGGGVGNGLATDAAAASSAQFRPREAAAKRSAKAIVRA